MASFGIDYEDLSEQHDAIDKIISEENWAELYIKIEKLFTNGSPERENKLAHIIYEQLDNAKKLDEFSKFVVEDGDSQTNRPILAYIVRSGDLNMFKKLYKSQFLSSIEMINSVSKTSDNTAIFDYTNLQSQFLTPQQKDACIRDKPILLIQTKQIVAIPVKYLINTSNPNKTITKGIVSSKEPIVKPLNLDSDNLGRGIINFINDYDPKMLDANFFRRNAEFLESLTMREIIVLSGYTHVGDRLVNILLRKESGIKQYIDTTWPANQRPDKRKLVPIYYQLLDVLSIDKSVDSVSEWLKTQARDVNFYKIIEECVEKYVAELRSICDRAPKLEKEMHVFRGTQNFYYGTDRSDVFVTGDFTSTTISPKITIGFIEEDCCFTQMKLKRGMRVIFMEPVSQHPGELEILIPPENRFRMTKNKIKKLEEISQLDADIDMSYKDLVCSETGRNVRFTLMESI